jgi:DNA-binding transcriptional MerR regulator
VPSSAEVSRHAPEAAGGIGVRQKTYSIGEFARLNGITAKALRHYDHIGVFHPTVIDSRTSYRRYTADQFALLHEVLALSRLGLPLKQVRDVMEERRGGCSLPNALMAAKRELEARLMEDRRRLDWINLKLADLARDSSVAADGQPSMDLTVVLKRQPPMRVVARRERIGSYDEADAMLDSLVRVAARAHGPPPGRGTVWHDCGARSGIIDCEAVVAVEPAAPRLPAASTGRARIDELPAATLACVLHRGSDTSLPATYSALHRWIAARGYTVIGPNREWYLGGVHDTPVVEIQFPVA